MSDYDSSLPVRTQNNGDVAAKIVDGTITSQALSVDATGLIGAKTFDGTGTAINSQSLSGTQWLQVVDPANGPSAPGTASAFSVLAGGIYNATPITLTDGQQSSLQLTSAGLLKVAATLSYDTNYGVVGANTLRTAAQIGNATGAADFNFGASSAQTLRTAALLGNASGLIDYNYGAIGAQSVRTASQIGNATGAASFGAGATSAQTLRTSSNLSDGAGTAITSTLVNSKQRLDVDLAAEGVTGAAVPFDSVQVAGSDGTNLRTLKTGTDGRLVVDIQNAAGEFTITNPLPVTIEASPGTHINDYKDASSIAAAGTDNHDYTVTAGKTLYLTQVESSGSGKAKMLLQIETGVATGVFTPKFAQFNSTATSDMQLTLTQSIIVAAGVRVRVTMTNRDNQAQDLYSTICGTEI